jgi:NitT/TauT family transport system substrate-binding protein
MPNRPTLTFFALAMILAGALTLAPWKCAAQTEPAPLTIRIGYIPVGDCMQLYVAEELGFFKEQGLAVELTPLKGGPLIAMAVESGELDAGWSNTASLAVAEDRGFDFAILSPGAFEREDTNRVHSLLVAAGSPITGLADLEGKTVAINALGNINEIAITALAAESGIDPKRIRLVEIPFPQMSAALSGGSVDAVLTLEPFVTLARKIGSARMLEPAALRAFGPRFLIAAWFAKREWIAANPGLADGFRTAVLKASAFIEAHPDRARDILTRHTRLSPELARSIALPYFAQTIEDQDMQPIIDLAARFDFISQSFPAARLRGPSPQK